MESAARGMVERLRAAGHIAYFAGGCVRDLLLGKIPKDFDIATSARPEEVQKTFARTYAVGAHFGVVVVLEAGFQVEVATYRSDGAYLDGRRPTSVHFSSPEEDACRRDFTINGMFYDPPNESVIDFVGGREDLAARRIRAIGEPAERFAEDRLRLLRAIRFATSRRPPGSARLAPSGSAKNSCGSSSRPSACAVGSYSIAAACSRSFYPKSRR